MFVITYRIYRIFQSRSIISKSLSDKRLLIVIIVIMIVTFLYKVFTLLTSEFYFSTYDDIIDSRYPMWLFQIMKSMI